VSYPEQPGGQQLPVCENGHPMTTVDSSCPLCGAGHRPGEPAGGFPAAAGPQPGYPAPPAGRPEAPTQDGYQPGGYQPGGYQPGGYQQGGFAASPSGGYPPPPASGYGSPAAGGYQASPGPGYWQQPGQPGQPVYARAAKTNVFAIISLVAGILWFFWLGSIVAVICGLVALGQTKARNEGGRGIAIAGIVLGAIGMVTLALFIIFGLVVAHTNSVQNTG
jgi:Domain of unknown function (DUF4190)